MVGLFEQNIRENGRQSSKGNQLKWENEGIWYKADYTGYEGLTEYVVSHLLQKSTLAENEYVLYDPVQIQYKNTIYNGAKSRDFLKGDWQIITLERLFKLHYNKSLYKSIFTIADCGNRLHFLIDQVKRLTGLSEFGKYISKLFTIDAFFLNEDRHMHNIAVLMNGAGEFTYCPVFDNGAGLLSDAMMDYPMHGDVYSLMGDVSAKSICSSFEEQLDLAEAAYGRQIRFCFDKKDVDSLLEGAEMYSEDERKRVRLILYQQIKKYEYLFS